MTPRSTQSRISLTVYRVRVHSKCNDARHFNDVPIGIFTFDSRYPRQFRIVSTNTISGEGGKRKKNRGGGIFPALY